MRHHFFHIMLALSLPLESTMETNRQNNLGQSQCVILSEGDKKGNGDMYPSVLKVVIWRHVD